MSATAKPTPCRCPVYAFPHRRCDRCDDAEMEALDVEAEFGERSQAEINAEMLALHDAAEARAINSGAW